MMAYQFSTFNVAKIQSGDLNGDGLVDLITIGNTGQGIAVYLGNGTTSSISLGQRRLNPQGISLSGIYDARQAQETLDAQLDFISAVRGNIGASQSRVRTALGVLSASALSYQTAESRIRDTDIAADAAEATRLRILQQTGAAVLAQANQQPALALRLLKM